MKVRSTNPIRWVLLPGSKTFSAPRHGVFGMMRTPSNSRSEGRLQGPPLSRGVGGARHLLNARVLNGPVVCEHAQEHNCSIRLEPSSGVGRVLVAVSLHQPPSPTNVVGQSLAGQRAAVQQIAGLAPRWRGTR